MPRFRVLCALLGSALVAGSFRDLIAQSPAAAPSTARYTLNGVPATCASCGEWSVPHAAVRLYGNTWYVGTNELSSVLIVGSAGHVLIDPGLEETVPQLLANIRAAGVNPRDIKYVLTSHVHYDHAGGVGALVKATGAKVAALPWSAKVIERGTASRDDPQYGIAFDIAPVRPVQVVQSGETIRVGSLTLRALSTPGHTPGSTTWSWRSCDDKRVCVDVVYADSQTPVSADNFLFTSQRGLAEQVEAGQKALEALPCRLLITPHPGASRLWERVAQGSAASADSLLDVTGCQRYAQRGRAAFLARDAREEKR